MLLNSRDAARKHFWPYALKSRRCGRMVLHCGPTLQARRRTLMPLRKTMAVANAALVRHGRALDVLQQDVRQLRSSLDELRRSQGELLRGQAELHARIDRLEATTREEAAARHAELLAAIHAMSGGSPPA
jgi:septal ring factor EnvC (AmiA/AmiB activator)